MKRREFLMGAAAVAGLASTTRVWAAQGGSAKLARVGVSSRNFDAIIKMGVGAASPTARTLDFLDLPQMIADKFGVHNVELQHSHFLSTEDAYLKDVRDRVAKSKSQIIQISTAFTGTTASSSGPTRLQGVDLAKMWIDHAEALGCPRVMVSAGPLGENVRAAAIDALKSIADYAKAHKVTISIQNMDTGVMPPPPPAPPPPPPPPPPDPAAEARGAAPAAGRRGGGAGGGTGGGGRSGAPAKPATWQVIAEVAKASGILVTPSLAGFPSEAERTAGLAALYALSNGNSHVSMNPGKIDLAAAIKISKDAAYKGLYTIVTDDAGTDPAAATKAVLDELVRLI